MNDLAPKTFDTLWETTEVISSKTFENLTTPDLIKNFSELVSELQEFYNLNYPDAIKTALKKKKVGEILYILTAISLRENINVYAELQKQKAENEIGNFKLNPQLKQ